MGLSSVARDTEGFLLDPADWGEALAEAMAQQENLCLTPDHWEVLGVLREFYLRYEVAPSMRPLVALVKRELGPDKGRSIYLMRLFPPSPARVASKIAGLPKPDHCL